MSRSYLLKDSIPRRVLEICSIVETKGTEDTYPTVHKQRIPVEEIEEYIQLTLTPEQAKTLFQL